MPKAKLRGPLSKANCGEVFLWVRDFGRMKAFYHEALGLPIKYENPHFAELNAGRLSIALHEERETHTAGNNWFMEFLVGNIDAVVAELRKRGVSVGPVRDEDFGRVTSFRDPEGNEIGLEEPRHSKR
ncbi:MAG TPA: VOC family protein [Thermoplasmata archaeon]|nr:VOC family protein [Thermoplasmata archaeon]